MLSHLFPTTPQIERRCFIAAESALAPFSSTPQTGQQYSLGAQSLSDQTTESAAARTAACACAGSKVHEENHGKCSGMIKPRKVQRQGLRPVHVQEARCMKKTTESAAA